MLKIFVGTAPIHNKPEKGWSAPVAVYLPLKAKARGCTTFY